MHDSDVVCINLFILQFGDYYQKHVNIVKIMYEYDILLQISSYICQSRKE